MAKKDDTAPASSTGFTIFEPAGKGQTRTAIRLADSSVISEDVDGHFFIEVNGVRHRVKSESTLEELAGLPPAEEE